MKAVGAALADSERGASFTSFYEQNVDFVWRNLRRMGVADSGVEDAAQEVFMVAFRQWSTVDNPQAWLFKVAFRTAQKQHRRIGRKEGKLVPFSEATLPPEAYGSADPSARIEASQALEALLPRLREKQRMIFILAELEDMTAREIGELLDLNINTVSARLRSERQDFEHLRTRLFPEVLPLAPAVLAAARRNGAPAPEQRQRLRALLVAGLPGGLSPPTNPVTPSPLTPALLGLGLGLGAARLRTIVLGSIAGGAVLLGLWFARGRLDSDRRPASPPTAEGQTRSDRDWIAPILRAPELAPAPPAAVHSLFGDFLRDPDRHPNVPDVSYAGYAYGEADLPSPDGPLFDVRTAPYGAAGDGRTDDTAAIRRALAAVGPKGGVVYLPAGTYLLSDVLFVRSSHTILRGESRENTRLVFQRPLGEIFSTRSSSSRGNMSHWLWEGGLIWMTPFAATENAALPVSRLRQERWEQGKLVGAIEGSHTRGTRVLTIDRFADVAPGATVVVEIFTPSKLDFDDKMTGGAGWIGRFAEGAAPFQHQGHALRWPVEVASVDGKQITLRQPLRFDLPRSWRPTLRAVGRTIEHSGVERLTIVTAPNPEQKGNGRTDGWNAVYFENALHGFLRDVTIRDAQIGILASAVKNMTFRDFSLVSAGPWRALGEGIVLRRVHDVLIERFDIDPRGWAGVKIPNPSTGVVLSKGRLPLKKVVGFPYDTVFTEVSVLSLSHPLQGGRTALWNVNLAEGDLTQACRADHLAMGAIIGVPACAGLDTHHPKFGDSGSLVDQSGAEGKPVHPPNLYQAQLEARRARE